MKRKSYLVKGTPIVPSVCSILMAVLWYLDVAVVNGKWEVEMNAFSFEGLAAFGVFERIITLVIPLVFFVAVLFLAEINLRWVTVGLIAPVVLQTALFIAYLRAEQDYFFENPVSFLLPFLVLILFALTVEGIIPTKWVLVGFCAVAALLPIVLTHFKVGEFFYQTYEFNVSTYQWEPLEVQLWSAVFSLSLYYIGIGALAVQMKVRPSFAEKDGTSGEGSDSPEPGEPDAEDGGPVCDE